MNEQALNEQALSNFQSLLGLVISNQIFLVGYCLFDCETLEEPIKWRVRYQAHDMAPY